MLIELRFVNEKPPRREAEIRKVVCVFGNDSKRDIKRSSMRRVHIDGLEELVRHSKIINTTKTFTMKKLHHGRITAAWWGEKESNLDLLENEQNPSALPTELQAPSGGESLTPYSIHRRLTLLSLARKGRSLYPIPGAWAQPL